MIKIGLIFLATAVYLSQTAYAQDEILKRKSGLWEVTVSSHNQGPAQTAKHCVDESTDAQMQQAASMFGQNCSKKETRREGAAFVSEAICKMGATQIHSKSIFRGDFFSTYEGDVVATYDPPLMNLREARTKISARWLGPCEAGQKPGDMIMSNGAKMNISDFMNMKSLR